jgi:hypothetical protein
MKRPRVKTEIFHFAASQKLKKEILEHIKAEQLSLSEFFRKSVESALASKA